MILLRAIDSDALVEETVLAVFLFENEDEGDLVDGVVFEHVGVPLADDLVGLIDAHDFERVVQVRDGDLLDFDDQEIMVSQTALKQSRHVMVVADHLKFKRTAPLKICALKDVNKLFTDAVLHENLQAGCGQWGTEVVVVEP